jgi:hypothetical protein
MIVINKRFTLTGENKKIEFDLEDLPEGEDEVQLTIEPVNQNTKKTDFSSWSSSIEIPSHLIFNREEIYENKES